MTVSSTTSRASYTGDGSTVDFSIPFYFLENEDIRAIKVLTADGTETELVLDTDFTLTGAGEQDGGTLTTTDTLSSDYTLVIFRDPSVLQQTQWPEADPFPAESHEKAADRLVMVAQRVTSLVLRSLRQPEGDVDGIDTLPAKVDRASTFLAFDADGDPIASSSFAGEAVVSAFVDTLLDDETAGDFMTTLGITAFSQTLLDDATAAAVLTTLGVTAYAQTLLDDANAATARATLDTYSTSEVDALLADLVPAGTMLDFGGASVPDGFLACDGSNVSRTTYATLFAAIGTTWGVGDGATTFGLPDARRRAAVGSGGTGTGTLGNAVGDTGGAETHTLTTAELAAHTHANGTLSAASGGAHTHDVRVLESSGGATTEIDVTGTASSNTSLSNRALSDGAHSHSVTGSTASAGSDTAHNIMQPSYVVTKIIKT